MLVWKLSVQVAGAETPVRNMALQVIGCWKISLWKMTIQMVWPENISSETLWGLGQNDPKTSKNKKTIFCPFVKMQQLSHCSLRTIISIRLACVDVQEKKVSKKEGRKVTRSVYLRYASVYLRYAGGCQQNIAYVYISPSSCRGSSL